ncbi:MAG: tetratricopeptide repeat protein [Candidatus Krumholzibacteria bacterium]|nr:tetratricopeptide repeat protein [Candidatus Krumholzibacteria bacterium]
MRSRVVTKHTLLGALAALALSGCYGGQLIKGPINSENASQQADSIRAEHRRVLLELSGIRHQLEEERAARIRYEAQTGVTLGELEESVRILVGRLEDSEQLRTRSYQQSRSREQAAADTARADTTRATRPGAGGDADEVYRAAYLDVTRGNYDLAIKGFQNYLVRFPSGPHLPEVHYYLAECYYAQERYLEAVGEFQYVIREFSDSRLVPASYLKAGRCYRRLEERNLAVRAFESLIAAHPDSEEAAQAREELEQLRGQ